LKNLGSGSSKLENQRILIEGWVRSSDNPIPQDISKVIVELKNILSALEKKKENSLEKEETISLLRQVQIFQDPN
jgi:uncharacterized protein (UPF0147 family)